MKTRRWLDVREGLPDNAPVSDRWKMNDSKEKGQVQGEEHQQASRDE